VTKYNAYRVANSKPEAYECNAPRCGECLYEDEMQACEDCGDLFCEAHIFDVSDDAGERYLGTTEPGSVYLCAVCATKRMRKGANREMRDDDGRGFADEDAA